MDKKKQNVPPPAAAVTHATSALPPRRVWGSVPSVKATLTSPSRRPRGARPNPADSAGMSIATGTGKASKDVSFGFSKTRTAMIVKRCYLKRQLENTSSTSSICFSHESGIWRHTPLVGFSSFISMHYLLYSS